MAKRTRTLFVKRITANELRSHWNLSLPTNFLVASLNGSGLFIRSNAKGEINWATSPVYVGDELKGKKVVILNELKAV